jgi:hypothetical protein
MPKLAACLHLLVSRDMRFNVKDLVCRLQETYMPTYRMISVMYRSASAYYNAGLENYASGE